VRSRPSGSRTWRPSATDASANESGRLTEVGRPLSTSTIRSRGPRPPFSSRLPPPADSPWEGICEASASIPRPDGRPAWFVVASAAVPVGSRTDLPHCTPLRRLGVGEARDWLHLFVRGDHRDRWMPEPLVASAPYPDNPSEPPAVSPCSRGPQSPGRRSVESIYGPVRAAQVPIFLRFTHFPCGHSVDAQPAVS
jgi:hypothetical protein